ncbi:transmembrane protein, putative, partial [Rhizoctonia solani AG-3 Rhs1AP]
MARSLVVGALAVVSIFAGQAYAQIDPIWSNVTCTDQLWSVNSAGQTPCLVSAYLSAQCTTDNSWGVPAIGTEGPYSPPNGTYANRCRGIFSRPALCARVVPLALGNGGPLIDSSTVTTTASQGGYPLSIPSGVLVPHWAYYDFTLSGIFNAVIASQQTGAESSAVTGATSTGSSASATGVSRTSTKGAAATSTSLPSSDDSQSSGSNTGAIVGGVVGGIFGIALIAVIAFIVIRKNKQNKNPATENQYNQGHYNPSTAQPGTGAPMMGQHQPVVQHSGMSPVAGSEYKPYDPRQVSYVNNQHKLKLSFSDPSTFPSHTYTAPSHYAESIPYSHQTQARPGQYNGVPEI